MKTTLGCIRRADDDFHMIENGDRVAVGVSGGKDSLLLLEALSLYRRFSRKTFSITALTIRCADSFDASPIRARCAALDVPYLEKETEIFHILFDVRKEKNPCALCAKMRRGALCDLAREAGCNKLALGHHRDDALETLLMSLLFEARLHTFEPVSYLSRSNLTVIRPMIYLPEKHVIHMTRELNLPVVTNPCPVDGHTRRQEMKDLLQKLCDQYPHARQYMLSALQNDAQYGLWVKPGKDGNAHGR